MIHGHGSQGLRNSTRAHRTPAPSSAPAGRARFSLPRQDLKPPSATAEIQDNFYVRNVRLTLLRPTFPALVRCGDSALLRRRCGTNLRRKRSNHCGGPNRARRRCPKAWWATQRQGDGGHVPLANLNTRKPLSWQVVINVADFGSKRACAEQWSGRPLAAVALLSEPGLGEVTAGGT